MIAYNPGVIGFELAQAMRSRFCLAATVKTNLTSAAALGVADKAIKVAGQLGRWYEAQEFAAAGGVTEGTEFETSPWAPQMRELLAFKRIADEFGEIVAARNLLGVAEEEDAGGQMAAALEAHFGAGVAATGLQIA